MCGLPECTRINSYRAVTKHIQTTSTNEENKLRPDVLEHFACTGQGQEVRGGPNRGRALERQLSLLRCLLPSWNLCMVSLAARHAGNYITQTLGG
jgi:hypothetical protein